MGEEQTVLHIGSQFSIPRFPFPIGVTPPRLERGTYSLEGCCSIQLSYGAFNAQLHPLRYSVQSHPL